MTGISKLLEPSQLAQVGPPVCMGDRGPLLVTREVGIHLISYYTLTTGVWESGQREPISQPGCYLLAAPRMILGGHGLGLEMNKRNTGLFAGVMCSEIAAFSLDQPKGRLSSG